MARVEGEPLLNRWMVVSSSGTTNTTVLTSPADGPALAEHLCGGLTQLGGRNPLAAVRESMMNHERVDEVFADDASLSTILQKVWSRGDR